MDYFIEKANEIGNKYLWTNIHDDDYYIYKEELWGLFYKMELINISRAIDYVDLSKNEELYSYLSENWLNIDVIIHIHKILTYWFDEVMKFLEGRKLYYPWILRNEYDKLFVWGTPVCSIDEMNKRLNTVFDKFWKINSIYDVYEIHWILYSSHPFCNWNKRMSRIIENLLMNYYNFTDWLISTTGYYVLEKTYSYELVENCIRSFNLESWIKTAKISTLISLYDDILFWIATDIKEILDSDYGEDWNNKYPSKFCFNKWDIVRKLQEDFKMEYAPAFEEAWEIINYLLSSWMIIDFWDTDFWDTFYEYNIDVERFWKKFSILEKEIEEFFYNNPHLISVCENFLFTKRLNDIFYKELPWKNP